MPRLLAALVVLGCVTSLAAQTAETKTAADRPILQAIIELDANMDTTLERDEIPESGLKAFDTLLKYGDKNKNGKLEADEMRGLAETLRQNAGAGLARFAMMDADKDGSLSKDEFPGPPALFDRIDTDSDGKISKAEAGKFAPEATKGAPGLRKQGQGIAAMDTDGDGKVSRDEFKGRPAQFDRIDTNGDGYLNREELRARFQATAKKSAKKAEAEKKTDAKPAPAE